MIARLKDEGMLQPLNFDNIPNYQHIHEGFQGLYYDPDNQYSVPLHLRRGGHHLRRQPGGPRRSPRAGT